MTTHSLASPLLRPVEVAEILALRNPRSIYHLARPGGPLAPARVQVGGHIRFHRAALEALLAAGGMQAAA